MTQVVGVPDQRMGEEICAWVRCKSGVQLTADELRQFCRQNVKNFCQNEPMPRPGEENIILIPRRVASFQSQCFFSPQVHGGWEN